MELEDQRIIRHWKVRLFFDAIVKIDINKKLLQSKMHLIIQIYLKMM